MQSNSYTEDQVQHPWSSVERSDFKGQAYDYKEEERPNSEDEEEESEEKDLKVAVELEDDSDNEQEGKEDSDDKEESYHRQEAFTDSQRPGLGKRPDYRGEDESHTNLQHQPSLPTRLFEIFDSPVQLEDGRISYGQLREARELDPPPKFCTVSYVWGDLKHDQGVHVPGIPWFVPVESEHKLRFMLESCLRQGYKYAWIDLLCIRQGDHNDPQVKSEQLQEFPKMRKYYADAHATIVFGEKYRTFATSWAEVAVVYDLWVADRETVEGTNGQYEDQTLTVVWNGLGAIDNLLSDTWFLRVWTLQEAVLPFLYSQLITSDGVKMNLRALFELVDWTAKALGTNLLNESCGDARYDYIYPGAGVVNDHDWSNISKLLSVFNFKESPIHPLQLNRIMENRVTSRPVDRWRGVYGILSPKWHVDATQVEAQLAKMPGLSRQEREEYLAVHTWHATMDKYIEDEHPDCTPLLEMRVNTKDQYPKRSWCFGDECGKMVPGYGQWINHSMRLGPSGELHLTAAGISKIEDASETFGDGSGELGGILYELQSYAASVRKPDISAVLQILLNAIIEAASHDDAETSETVEACIQTARSYDVGFKGPKDTKLLEMVEEAVYAQGANAVSSQLRDLFDGWNRWLVESDNMISFVWFPFEEAGGRERLKECFLMWPCEGHNQWAVVLEKAADKGHGYRKVGVAFVNCEHPGPPVENVVIY
ncbi:heterokaryon incompatibility protein-domain-containing protein [Peziza echinospora]|nr:heterokaryon incompatibility protein-domain-containing protein [Peziza echinospora]